MEYGLTDKGFITKPFEVILEEEQRDFRTMFGNDIDLSAQSIAGAYCRNIALKLSRMWELLSGFYTSTSVKTASGIYLDRIANYLNISRRSATRTIVKVCAWGKHDTRIQNNHLVRDSSNNTYYANGAFAISKNQCIGAEMQIKSSANNDVFIILINGEQINFTASGNLNKRNVRDNLQRLINEKYENQFIFETVKNDLLRFYLAKGDGAIQIDCNSPNTLELKQVGTIHDYLCNKVGSIYCGAFQCANIVNNVNGLNTVINYIEGETGLERESDDDFRIAIKERQKNASGTEIAIQNAVTMVENVRYCRIYSNRASETDLRGRPAKSFEVVVSGGKDDEIANTIFNVAPAGIEAYGTTKINVTDSENNIWEIGFSRPVNKYIWLKVTYNLNTEETLNADVENAIKNNLVEWANENLAIGVDLILQKLFSPIYQVSGLKDVTITVATSNDLIQPEATLYLEKDVIIDATEIPLIEQSRILVSRKGLEV